MKGHTEKSTINERSPLTENMREVLHQVNVRGSSVYPTTPARRGVYPREMYQSEKNAAKALAARGMISWDNGCWIITDAGRAALQKDKP